MVGCVHVMTYYTGILESHNSRLVFKNKENGTELSGSRPELLPMYVVPNCEVSRVNWDWKYQSVIVIPPYIPAADNRGKSSHEKEHIHTCPFATHLPLYEPPSISKVFGHKLKTMMRSVLRNCFNLEKPSPNLLRKQKASQQPKTQNCNPILSRSLSLTLRPRKREHSWTEKVFFFKLFGQTVCVMLSSFYDFWVRPQPSSTQSQYRGLK
jgi:hypothetical protein